MLHYSFKLRDAHDAILKAVGKAIANGNRTGDVFDPANSAVKKVGTQAMGDAIAAAI